MELGAIEGEGVVRRTDQRLIKRVSFAFVALLVSILVWVWLAIIGPKHLDLHEVARVCVESEWVGLRDNKTGNNFSTPVYCS